jgi:hypothetical protein
VNEFFCPAPKSYRAPRKPKGLRAKNPERAARKFEDAFLSKEYVEWVHEHGCVIPGCRKVEVHAAHVGPTRACGGKWFEIVGLCPDHHREQEGDTEGMNEKYGVDLIDVAAWLAMRWKERTK